MKNKILKYALDTCSEHNCELLFLTIMGSRLYGTELPASDYDVKGIMLPSTKDLVLRKATHNINRKETENPLGIDFELYSIQEYFKLLSSGETISADMLFAPSYLGAVIYVDEEFQQIFDNIDKLIAGDRLDKNPYLRYAYSQAVKYGIKGNRYEVIQKVLKTAKSLYENAFEHHPGSVMYLKLVEYLDELAKAGENNKYCFVTDIEVHKNQRVPGLYLAGKMHQGTIKLSEFIERAQSLLNDYGHRAKLAAQADGNDWKALSHAVRAVCQLNELLRTGKIKFPRAEAQRLLDIKQGKISFEEVKEIIENNIKFFDEAIQVSVAKTYRWRQTFVDEFIFSFYEFCE
jgi:hypothetical protein